MDSKPHRMNSDFGLKYFLAGNCSTADGAWILLYTQMINAQERFDGLKGNDLRFEASILKNQEILDNAVSIVEKLEAEATLLDLKVTEYSRKMNAEGVKKELETIKRLMKEIEPYRKYGHLPILEASEACQREEWLGELQKRAENYLITQGTIPHDQLQTMRNHPDFDEKIIPFIQNFTKELVTNQKAGMKILSTSTSSLSRLGFNDDSTKQS
jgi:hypothetical protein